MRQRCTSPDKVFATTLSAGKEVRFFIGIALGSLFAFYLMAIPVSRIFVCSAATISAQKGFWLSTFVLMSIPPIDVCVDSTTTLATTKFMCLVSGITFVLMSKPAIVGFVASTTTLATKKSLCLVRGIALVMIFEALLARFGKANPNNL